MKVKINLYTGSCVVTLASAAMSVPQFVEVDPTSHLGAASPLINSAGNAKS
jgi:hypothetical protein